MDKSKACLLQVRRALASLECLSVRISQQFLGRLVTRAASLACLGLPLLLTLGHLIRQQRLTSVVLKTRLYRIITRASVDNGDQQRGHQRRHKEQLR